MNDLICRKTMMRCPTPGMCSPHGGCPDPVRAELQKLKSENRLLQIELETAHCHWANDSNNVQASVKEIARLTAENEALRKDADRYRGIRRIANTQGYTDPQFDEQTDGVLAKAGEA